MMQKQPNKAVRMLQEWAVPMVGIQLGMRKPSSEAALLAVYEVDQLCRDEGLWKDVRGKAVYCGDGCIKLSLRKTAWANQFREGKDGGNWEVTLRYGMQALSQPSGKMVDSLRELSDEVLISDKPMNEPCHAKLLSAMHQYYTH